MHLPNSADSSTMTRKPSPVPPFTRPALDGTGGAGECEGWSDAALGTTAVPTCSDVSFQDALQQLAAAHDRHVTVLQQKVSHLTSQLHWLRNSSPQSPPQKSYGSAQTDGSAALNSEGGEAQVCNAYGVPVPLTEEPATPALMELPLIRGKRAREAAASAALRLTTPKGRPTMKPEAPVEEAEGEDGAKEARTELASSGSSPGGGDDTPEDGSPLLLAPSSSSGNWLRFCANVLELRLTTSIDIEFSFDMLDQWFASKNTKRRAAASFASSRVPACEMKASNTYLGDLLMDDGSKLQRCVLHPHQTKRMIWSIGGLAFLALDAVLIPLQVFDFGDELNDFFKLLSLTSATYWAFDIPVQCFVGFQSQDGTIEMRPSFIRHHYFRRWFIPDLVVVIIDALIFMVFDVADEQESNESGDSVVQVSTRSLRFARFVRMLRLVRLLRARRLKEMTSSIRIRLKSEAFVLFAKLFEQVTLILMANHYIACAWFALGMYAGSEGTTWLSLFGDEDTSAGFYYCVSLHWSLTQFTPSTQNIAPQSTTERLFAIFVVLFALLAFSSFLSSVTNAVNQLKVVNMGPVLEQARFREFLMAHTVSTELASKIHMFFEQHYVRQQKRVHESDIKFFSAVPEILLIQLHEQLYMSKMSEHFILQYLALHESSLMCNVCHTAMSELSRLPRQAVFIDGRDAQAMYMTTMGLVTYDLSESVFRKLQVLEAQEKKPAPKRIAVPLGQWLSEMALWVNWIHRGHAFAAEAIEIIALDTSEFLQIVIPALDTQTFHFLRICAVLAVAYAESVEMTSSVVTDLPIAVEKLEEVAHRARKFANIRMTSGARGVFPADAVFDLQAPSPFHAAHAEQRRPSLKYALPSSLLSAARHCGLR